MKHSIKQQMMMVFVGIVVVMMLVFMAVNGGSWKNTILLRSSRNLSEPILF